MSLNGTYWAEYWDNQVSFKLGIHIDLFVLDVLPDNKIKRWLFIQYCFIALNIRVKILTNSNMFMENLNTILKLTAVESTNYEFISNKDFNMSFDVEFKLTKHTPLLECYSLIFTKDKKKTLYTGDSNDIEFLKSAILDENYEDIYSEIGDYAPVHMDYNEVIKLDLTKVTLMHIESNDLHNRLIEQNLRIADYLK
jgi:hypothetical protein